MTAEKKVTTCYAPCISSHAGAERDTVVAARAGAVIEPDADFDASCGRRGLAADEHYSVPAECFAASPPD